MYLIFDFSTTIFKFFNGRKKTVFTLIIKGVICKPKCIFIESLHYFNIFRECFIRFVTMCTVNSSKHIRSFSVDFESSLLYIIFYLID